MIDYYVRTLLNAWGRYRRIGWDPKLGYDKVNILMKSPGGEDEEIPGDVLYVDRYIGTLPPKMRQVLCESYEKRHSLRLGAKAMEISKDKFSGLLRQAEQRITGYISAAL